MKSEDHGFAERGGIGPCDVPEMGEEGLLQSGCFRAPHPDRRLGGTVQQACRKLARHHVERRKTIDQLLLIPRSHYWALAFDPQGGAQRGHQRETRFILTLPDTLSRPCFFFSSASSACAPACRCGSPRRYR